MIINLNELGIKKEIIIDYLVEKDDDLDKRILDLKNSKVKGKIYSNGADEYILNCNFEGTMIISDSVTLKSIPYNFEINIDENLDDIANNYIDSYNFSKNTLDLKKILWQNIVLEVPISFTLEKDANLKGDGWELVSDNKKAEDVDPRLQKLKDLLER